MNSILKGAYLSYLYLILSNVVGLLLTPYTLRSLGVSEYGLYQTMGAFVIYFGILDFGLRNSTYRYISLYQFEKDKKKEETFISTSLSICYFIVFFLGILGFFIYNYSLDNLYENSFTSNELIKAKKMFILLILSLMVGFPAGIYIGVCNGYENFVFTRGLSIIRYLIRAVLIIIALFFDGDALALVFIDFILNFLSTIITYYFVVKKLKVKLNLDHFDKKLIKEIFSYSIWVFIFTIISHTQWLSGQFILGVTTNTKTVAIYSIGVLLGTYYTLFAYTIFDLLLPKATEVNSRQLSGIDLTKEIVKISRFIFFLLTIILVSFYFLGSDFVFLWAGNGYEEAWLLAFLIMLTVTFPLTYHYGFSIVQAQNKLKNFSIINLVILFIFVILGYFISFSYGGLGFLICILASIIINTFFTLYLFKKILNFNLKYYLKKIYLNNFFLIIFTIIITYFIDKIFMNNSWFYFGIKSMLIIIFYSLFLYKFSLNQFEKSIIKEIIIKFKKR